MREISRVVNEELYISKLADSLYAFLMDSYIERFLIAVDHKLKLKLAFEQPLLEFVYQNSHLKEKKLKKVRKDDLVDFKGKL